MDTNKYEIVLTDTAKEELKEIYEYISKQLYEEKAAIRLMNKIEHSILILEENPYCCKEVHIKPHNDVYRKLVMDNYIALYDIDENKKKVIIYRIVYGKMDYLKIIE